MWRDEGYLLDILNAARRIVRFTKDLSEEQFLEDELTQSAVIRQFEIIGEAAGRISAEFVVDHPEIPWRAMVSMRNVLIHEYTRVRMDTVWQAVQEDIPALMEVIEPLVPAEEE